MIIQKRFCRLISFSLSFTLLFQTFTPAFVFAQAATQSAEVQTETVTPTSSETPAIIPTEEITPTPTEIPAPEATPELTPSPTEAPTPVPTPELTAGSDPAVPLWIQVDGDTVTTNENVAEGVDYRFKDSNAVVRFTKVTKPGKLTIREVKLTPEQIESSGALSDTAYDITSEMENGSFLYDLILPLPQDNPNAKVEFASDQNSLDQSVVIDINVTKNPDTIEIKGLDHFTIFFVSGGVDQATHGDMCVLYDCTLDADHPSLRSVDLNYLNISSFDASVSASWPDSEELIPDGDNYVQFDFSPDLDPDVVFPKVHLKFVYKTNEIDTSDPENKPFGAKLVISSEEFADEELFVRDVTPNPANLGDQFFDIDLLPEFENSNDLNNLQVRLYLFGTAVDGPGVTTSFNQVALIVPPPTPELVFPPDGSLIKASDAILDWTDVTDVLGESVTYYYRSSWIGGSYPSDFATGVARTTSSIDARGSASRTYNWQVRACAGLDNCSDWSGFWEVTIDGTQPTIPGTPTTSPNPTNQASQVWNWSASTDTNGIFQYLWEVIGGPSGTVSDTSLTTNLGEGIWGLSIKAEDNAGNQGASSSGTVSVDRTGPPAPVITSPSSEQFFKTAPILNQWTAVTDPSGVKEYRIEYQYDDGHTFSGAPYRTTTATSRNHSPGIGEQGGVMIRVQALDNAGNYGDWGNWVHYYYDATAPTASITYSTTSPTNGNVIATLVPSETVTVTNNGGSDSYTFTANGSFIFEFVDAAGNAGSATATVENIDQTLPEVISLETQDNNHNGNIDAIKITFSENIDDSRLEGGPDGWSVEGYGEPSIETGEIENDNILVLDFPEGDAYDTAATPTIIYDPSGGEDLTSTHDFSGNELAYFSDTPEDKASPVLVSAITGDNDLNGRLDTIRVTLSEDINGSSSNPADYEVFGGYDIGSESEESGVVTLVLNEKETDNDTGAKPTVSLISGEGSGVEDLNDNWSYGENSVEAADGAAPVSIISAPEQGSIHGRAILIEGSSSDHGIDSDTVETVILSYRPNESDDDFIGIITLTNEGREEPFTWEYSWTPESDGSYEIKAAALDDAGNQEHSAIVSGIVYDTTDPILTYTDENPDDGLITNNSSQNFSVKLNENVSSCKLYFGSNGTVASATSQITWHHSYPEDTQWTWHFYSPSGRDYVFPDRYANAAGGWNQWLPPVIYDMSDAFSGDELNGAWRLQMRDNVGRDSGAITRIDLVLNDVSHLWTGSAGIWDYHTTAVDIPVESGSGGESSGTYDMNVSEDGLSANTTLDSISDGTYDYHVECIDQVDNEGSSSSRSITVDTVSPTGEISYSTTEFTNGSVTATLNPSETVTVTNNEGLFDYTFAANGSFEFIFADQSGNTGSATATVENIDTTDPESVITLPENDGSDNTIYTNDWNGNIEGTATDNLSGLARVELSIQRNSDGKYFDGGGWIEAEEDEPRVTADGTADWNYTLASPAEDSYEITSHAVDNAGNVEDSYKLTIVFDKTIPEVSLTIDPTTPDSGNNWYKTEPTITLTATDNTVTDHIEYQWDATTGTWSVFSLPFKTIDQGSHTLYYRAFDKAGNVSDTGIKNVKYDEEDLTNGALNVSVSPNPTSGTTAKVKWDAASDNIGIEKYEVNWSLDGTSTSYTDTVGNEVREHEINKLDQEGKWNITVTAFDFAGNRKSGSTELTVDRGAPAAPTLTLGGTGVGSATLTWNKVTDANDYIIWYGNTSGTYLYGARTGDVDNFTVRGLGGGDYYFVIQSVDNAGNRSGNSNEVSTLALAGTPGVEPGTPAEGFTPEVKGETTSETPTVSVSPTPEVLGETDQNNFPWWLILLLIATGGYASWLFLHRK